MTGADESFLAFRQFEKFDGNFPSVLPGKVEEWPTLSKTKTEREGHQEVFAN
jgi:hypothetical protein